MFSSSTPIYVAGHRGLVGSALMRALESRGYTNLITRTRAQLDLTNQAAVNDFFAAERPQLVFLAAAYDHGTAKLVNLGSSCIYPKLAPQPMKEEHLLTGPLEPTQAPCASSSTSSAKTARSSETLPKPTEPASPAAPW